MTIKCVPADEIWAPEWQTRHFGEFAGQHVYTLIDYVPYKEHWEFMKRRQEPMRVNLMLEDQL